MIKKVYKLFTVVVFLIVGCKNKEKSTIQNKNTITINRVEKREQNLLQIEGENIWIRDTPKKGKVVMKLHQGDLCAILDVSNKTDTIRGYVDYWYQIKHKDTIGWVFGSQTNIKSTQSENLLSFLDVGNNFIRALSSKNTKVLNGFIHIKHPIHCCYTGPVGGRPYKRIKKISDLINAENLSINSLFSSYVIEKDFNILHRGKKKHEDIQEKSDTMKNGSSKTIAYYSVMSTKEKRKLFDHFQMNTSYIDFNTTKKAKRI